MQTSHHPLATFLLALISVLPVQAQAPAGPKIMLAPPTGQVVWSIRYTYQKPVQEIAKEKKEDLAAKSLEMSDLTRPDKVRFVIRNPVSSRIVDVEGGAKEEAYYFGNFEFRIASKTKEILMTDLDSYPSADQLFRKRFPGVDWAKPKLFVRIEDAHGEPCAYFRDGNPAKLDPKSEVMDDIMDSSKYQIREAWFSVKTGLPVAFKVGDTLAKYAFEAPQTAEVAIPPSVRDKINEYGRYQAYVKQRAASASNAP
ncbi:MAG: hypothetical protein V4819_01950 [Verrucomicrobiota bacterium]